MAAGRMVAERSETVVPPRRLDLKTKLLTAVRGADQRSRKFLSVLGHEASGRRAGGSLRWPTSRLIFSPWVLLGTTLLILWLLSRMTLLGWADLSYVLPVTSIGYVLTAFLGKYFFAEQITWQRWLGTARDHGRHRSWWD